MLIALDTETTGRDFFHGSRPFFITICDENGKEVIKRHWKVDPVTRRVCIPEKDITEVAIAINDADRIVLQNAKFDYTALKSANPLLVEFWDWDRVEDTLIAGHILASNQPHNLTDMVTRYLGVNIHKYELAVKKAAEEARRFVRKRFPDWRISKQGLPDMPSVKGGNKVDRQRGVEEGSAWKSDMWLPRAVCEALNYSEDNPWWTVTEKYSLIDSACTMFLWNGKGGWQGMESKMKELGLWNIYRERMKLVPIAQKMEWDGVTMNSQRVDELLKTYREESKRAGDYCIAIARGMGYDLEMPKGASPNESLRNFFYTERGLNLPKPKRGKKQKSDLPSLDKDTLEGLELSLPISSKPLFFVQQLLHKRKRDTAIAYLEGYKRFWHPIEYCLWCGKTHPKGSIDCKDATSSVPTSALTTPSISNPTAFPSEKIEWVKVHPSLNPCGTDTLRWSMKNPNSSNIEKEPVDGHSLRYCFGPAPGREWYSIDGQNLELRIPSYLAPEPDLIWVFDHPDEPPYYGSYHYVIFDLLHPEKFKLHGKNCKKVYASTWYQWVKNGNFAIIYGAMEEKADATYRVDGAFRKIKHRFPNIAKMAEEAVRFAQKNGYVETFPNRKVDAKRGYPLAIGRTEWGQIEPTKPLNYKVQGTAMQWTNDTMVRCQEQLDEWNRIDPTWDGRIILQVHDEDVFDMPIRGDVLKDREYEKEKGRLPLFRVNSPFLLGSSNLWRIRRLQEIMLECGKSIGVPTTTGVDYHKSNWAEFVTL